MNTLRHNLMKRESDKRLRSAKILRQNQDDSDSAYLLELLAFELLLKIVVEKDTESPAPIRHKYEELFMLLSDDSQQKLLALAGERIGPSSLSTDHLAVLKELGSNYVDLRYPYKKYDGLTEQQYVNRGKDWLIAGGSISDADCRYHSEELFGLTHALQEITNEC